MLQDWGWIAQVIKGLLMEPIWYFPFALMSLLWLAAFNYQMALVAACMIPALAMLAWMFSGPMRSAFLHARETAAQAMNRIEETLTSISTARTFRSKAAKSARHPA